MICMQLDFVYLGRACIAVMDSWVVTHGFFFFQKSKIDGGSSTKRGRRKAAEESDDGESAKSEDNDSLEEEEEEEVEKKRFTFKEEDEDSDEEEKEKKKSAKKSSSTSSKKSSKVGASLFCVTLILHKCCRCWCVLNYVPHVETSNVNRFLLVWVVWASRIFKLPCTFWICLYIYCIYPQFWQQWSAPS